MKRHLLTVCVLVTLLVALGGGVALARPSAAGGAPTLVSYQGQVTVGGIPYSGTGYFKFAILDGAGATAWSNDGTSVGGNQPNAAVSLAVTNGLFTVLLGDSGMNALRADAFAGTDCYLRVWFCQTATGTFAQLAPDRRIAAVPYALQASDADTLDGQQATDLAAAGHNHDTSYWTLGGNAGTTGSNYLGTSDNVALELRVNGARALRLEPNDNCPNVIGGYSGNTVTGAWGATIGGGGSGGNPNSVTGIYGTVGGGATNTASGYMGATVAGGLRNTASGHVAVVAGGNSNQASGDAATVAGGFDNTAGGDLATIAGGYNNEASGDAATVAGGFDNTAGGNHSFAAGQRAKANQDGSFVWGDSTDADVASTAPNQFIVRASGGIWLGTTSSPSIPAGNFLNTSTGAYLSTGGAWTNNSDRNAKENLAPVDGQDVLDRLASVPVSTWNYRAEDDSVRHMGPMAQDFYASFGLGASETSIGTIDADGVALAAIQGLYAQNQALQAENAALRAQMAGIEARLAALEQGH